MLTINLSDEDVFCAVAGAGASQYEWYHTFGIDWENNRLTIRMDAEVDGDIEGAVLTPRSIRQAIRDLHAVNYPCIVSIDWSDPECDSDLDADGADCIIQQAVLGKVVFG